MLQGLSHGCVSLQETDHAPTVPHLVQVSCALSMYTLAPAFYQAIVLSTRHCSALTLPDLNMTLQALEVITLLLLVSQAVCTHACSAILRFLEVNKFPVTWCIA